MKLQLYQEIVGDIKKFSGLTRDCVEMLKYKYPFVSANSIHSIVSSEVIARMKISYSMKFGARNDYLNQYNIAKARGEPVGIILRMAAKTNFPPAFLARMVVENFLQNTNQKHTKADVTRLLKDTTLISHADLAYEIYLCILYDDRNGFFSDAFGLTIGYEYEIKLREYLKARNISFATEEELRTRGYDKTPDYKLELPIAVDGVIINWIESKARFGCPTVHKTHIKEQFLSYWNRFGPGLVIYWFGYVDELVDSNEKRFIMSDHFPENIIYMNPESLLPAKCLVNAES